MNIKNSKFIGTLPITQIDNQKNLIPSVSFLVSDRYHHIETAEIE